MISLGVAAAAGVAIGVSLLVDARDKKKKDDALAARRSKLRRARTSQRSEIGRIFELVNNASGNVDAAFSPDQLPVI